MEGVAPHSLNLHREKALEARRAAGASLTSQASVAEQRARDAGRGHLECKRVPLALKVHQRRPGHRVERVAEAVAATRKVVGPKVAAEPREEARLPPVRPVAGREALDGLDEARTKGEACNVKQRAHTPTPVGVRVVEALEGEVGGEAHTARRLGNTHEETVSGAAGVGGEKGRQVAQVVGQLVLDGVV